MCQCVSTTVFLVFIAHNILFAVLSIWVLRDLVEGNDVKIYSKVTKGNKWLRLRCSPIKIYLLTDYIQIKMHSLHLTQLFNAFYGLSLVWNKTKVNAIKATFLFSHLYNFKVERCAADMGITYCPINWYICLLGHLVLPGTGWNNDYQKRLSDKHFH